MVRHGLGIAAMLAHAQRQGLEALDELEGVERAHRGTEVAQQGDAGFEDVGDGPEGLGRFRPYGAVIAGVGLIEQREAFRMPSPIEVAAIDDEAADRGSVAPDVLGRGINDDGDAVLQRPAQHGRRGIVHDQRHAELPPNGCHLLDGEDGQLRIGQGLRIVGAGLVVSGPAEGVRVGGIDETRLDPHGPEGVGKEVPGAAVEIRGADDIVAGLGDILDGNGRGRLAGADGQRRHTAFECRDALLEHVGGRVHDAGIDVTKLLEGEEIRRMLGPAELVGGRLIDRHRHRSGRRIAAVGPAMEDESLGILRLGHRVVSFYVLG